MPFIIVADHKSQEIDRRELAGPVIIGRAPECDLPVRDILLSRRHCVLERIGDAWVVADMNSKNGTRVNSDIITRHVLRDGDVIRIGRTRIAFRDGPFIPATATVKQPRHRPADPIEAMAGTLAGFRFNEVEEEQLDRRVLETFPRPQPRPIEPKAYQSEQVYSMLSDIASSAWDSQWMDTGRTGKGKSTQTLPRPIVAGAEPNLAGAIAAPGRPATSRRMITLLYILLTMMVTGAGVWVISWAW